MATARQLEIFVNLAAARSMREVADSLGISQPSVSKQMRALERSVGGQLFIRSRGERVRLSPLGESLVRDADATLALQRRLTRGADKAERDGPVIFLRPFVLDQIKANLGTLFAGGLPEGTRFTLMDENDDIPGRVERTAGSFGLIRASSVQSRASLKTKWLRTEACSLLVAPQLASRIGEGELKIEEIPVLVPHGRWQIEQFIRHLLSSAGLNADMVRQGPQFTDLLLEDVLQGKGAGVFMDSHVTGLQQEGRLVSIVTFEEPLHLLLIANHHADPDMFADLSNLFADL